MMNQLPEIGLCLTVKLIVNRLTKHAWQSLRSPTKRDHIRTNNEHLHLGPRHNKPLKITAAAIASVGILRELNQAGITITQDGLEKMIAAYKSGAIAQDSFTQPITTPSITTPVQFLQAWLPGFVHVITQARKIDKLVGITTVGSWEDEEIVQGVMELVGGATPYSDYGNVPMSS